MSDLMITTAVPAGPSPDADEIRSALIGDRISIAQAAAAFRVTERSIYNLIEAHHIPYVKVFAVRYMTPNDLRRALVGDENSAPRRRGRPRKVILYHFPMRITHRPSFSGRWT
jgi:hypothetical protein